jgi:beta-carotene 3-hydroxylase
MNWLLFITITLLTFFAMEGITWLTHRYVMHGFIWYLHEDHHQPRPGLFEKNDAFFLIFALPSMILIILGSVNEIDYRFFIGIGIAVYGFCYFLVHDIFIHQRFRLFRRTNNVYMRALRKAHKVHHKHLGKEEGECFGMLIVPFRYYKEAKKSVDLMEN